MILGAAGGCIQGNLTRPCLLRGGLSRYHALAFVCNVDCATAGGRCRWETIAEEWGIGDKHLFHPWRSDGRVHIVVSWLIYRAPVLLPCYHCGLVCMHIYIGLLPSGSIDGGACWEVCVCVQHCWCRRRPAISLSAAIGHLRSGSVPGHSQVLCTCGVRQRRRGARCL